MTKFQPITLFVLALASEAIMFSQCVSIEASKITRKQAGNEVSKPLTREQNLKRAITFYPETIVEYSQADKDAILERHRELRQIPAAADMEYMNWNTDLADMSAQWSSACIWGHSTDFGMASTYSGNYGENLFMAGPGSSIDEVPDLLLGTNMWYDEVEFYTYDTNSCTKVCGHYTQIVWAASKEIGCGRAFCANYYDSYDEVWEENAWIVTCQYGPAGNYVGQSPYQSGSSCTKCASGQGWCYNGTCRDDCDTAGVSCDCNAVCENGGTVNQDTCECTCATGWYGSDCSTSCVDTHEYCGANPGWPASWCGAYWFVDEYCPNMCSYC